jgi:hypothetical protein
MTIYHTKHANGQVATPRPQTAGAVHAARFTFANTAGIVAASDIWELGVLPPYATIVDYILVPQGAWGAITGTVGLMSGDLGSDDPARTSGAELYAAGTALTAVLRGNVAGAFSIDSVEAPRGLGVKFSADVAADATKKLTLILFYVQ